MWYVGPAKAQTSLRIRTCSSESMLVKMPHCWKSHVTAHIICGSDSDCTTRALHMSIQVKPSYYEDEVKVLGLKCFQLS